MKFAASFLVLFVMLTGCSSTDHAGDAWQPAAIDPKSGQVIALWTQYREREDSTVLTLDYGMFVLWNEHERGFYLFNARTKRYYGTTDFDSFLTALGRLPKGITLEWINTCTAGSCWNMPETERNRLNQALAAGDLRTDRPYTSCTCESVGLKYLPIQAAAPTNAPVGPAKSRASD